MIGAGILLFVWVILNGIGYYTMKVDKVKAKRHQWRIPERQMFLIAFIGGAIGVYLGMRRFHHKTKHLQFIIFIPLFILWDCILVFGILRYLLLW